MVGVAAARERAARGPVSPDSRAALRRIRLLHTAVWALFAAAILALPLFICRRELAWALALSVLVWGEVLVLVLHRMTCPLTTVAMRHTADRSANFDIYLPLWLARHNQRIFGSLFAVDELLLLWRWLAP